ncbi:MAG: GNAT family protein [Pseudomonadota bacterium]
MPPADFLTQRLRLRPFAESDLPHIEAYALHESFWEFLPLEPQTPKSVRAFLDQRLADTWGEGGFKCAIELLSVDHVIGTVRISVTSEAHRSGDIGYALNPDFSGHGYMTEAVRRIIGVGFRNLNLHRIWATADVENARSWQFMERAGMRREGTLRDHKMIRGRWRDSVLYACVNLDG